MKAGTQAGWAGCLCAAVPETASLGGMDDVLPRWRGVPGMLSPWACPGASEWGPGTGSGVSGDRGYSLGSRGHRLFSLEGQGRGADVVPPPALEGP